MDATTVQEYQIAAQAVWCANKATVIQVAEASFAATGISPDTARAFPDLDKLLADLQHRSFLHGAICALFSVENCIVGDSEQAETEGVVQ
jgi:hypothetical protein